MNTIEILTAPLSQAEETAGKNWRIMNNSDTDVLVIHHFTDNDSPAKQFYEQSIKLLETTDGLTFIKAGTAGSIILQDSVCNTVIARADNLFPVKTITVSLDSATQTYPSASVTTDEAENMKQAAAFQQSIVAFPSSDLAKLYATALSTSDVNKVEAFFQSSEDYKSITLDMVLAVDSYFTMYPFVWAYFQQEKTYYLYNSDGKANKYLGFVVISNACTVPVNPDKSLPGFSIAYTKDDQAMEFIPLYYSNGQFVDDVNSENPGICLSGLFIQKSQLTKKDIDNGIVCTLTGSVYGKDAIGFDEEVIQLDENNRTGLDALLHPEDTEGRLELYAYITLALLGIGVLARGIKYAIDTWRENPPTPAEIQAKIREQLQATLDKMNKDLRIPEDVNASLDGIKKQANDLLLQENNLKLKDIVDRQYSSFVKLNTYKSSTELQEVFDNLDFMKTKLPFDDLKALSEQTKGILDEITNNSKVLDKYYKAYKSGLSYDYVQKIEQSRVAIDDFTEQIEENERIRYELTEDPAARELREFFDFF